jgi:hypothetical protein
MTKGTIYKLYEKLDATMALLKNKKLAQAQKQKLQAQKKEILTSLYKK